MARILNDLTQFSVANEKDGTLDAEAIAKEAAALAEIEDQETKRNSVVPSKYKTLYKTKAQARGDRGKAAKRSVWDRFARIAREETLDDNEKTDVAKLMAFLEANGVDHTKWDSRTPGWQGRLRMTGVNVLRRQTAETGVFYRANGEQIVLTDAELAALVTKYSL